MIRTWNGFVVAMLFSASAVAAEVPRIEFSEQTLGNGLHVIYAPRAGAGAGGGGGAAGGATGGTTADAAGGVAHVRVVYHVGSKNERADRQGFAHLFEHMMFRGSAHVGPDEHARLIDSVGGICNGETEFDQTSYWETIPSEQTELALWLEADRMASFQPSEAALVSERKVVAQEWAEQFDRPFGSVMNDFFGVAFQRNNYRWPPIGNMEQLLATRVDELREFFKQYYVPNNATLVIAGDFDAAKTRAMVSRFFSWIPRGEAPVKTAMPAEPPTTHPTAYGTSRPLPGPQEVIAVHTPPIADADTPALRVFAGMLGGELHRMLVTMPRPLATRVDTSVLAMENGGLLRISVMLAPGISFQQLEDAVFVQTSLIHRYLTGKDVRSAVETVTLIQQIERETAAEVARELSDAAVLCGSAAHANGELAAITKLSGDDVDAMATKYFSDSRAVMLRIRPDANAARRLSIDALAGRVANSPVLPSTRSAGDAARQAVLRRVAIFPEDFPTSPPRAGLLGASSQPTTFASDDPNRTAATRSAATTSASDSGSVPANRAAPIDAGKATRDGGDVVWSHDRPEAASAIVGNSDLPAATASANPATASANRAKTRSTSLPATASTTTRGAAPATKRFAILATTRVADQPAPPEADRNVLKINGGKAIILPDSNCPVIHFSLVLRQLPSDEPAGKEGVASLTASVLLSQSRRSIDALNRPRALEMHGGAVSAAHEFGSTRITGWASADDLPDVIERTRRALRRPDFYDPNVAETALRGAKLRLCAEMADAARSPGALVLHELAQRMLFASVSQPSVRQIMSLGLADVRSFHVRAYHPEGAVLVIGGNVTAEAGEFYARQLLDDWSRRDGRFSESAPRSGNWLARLFHQSGPDDDRAPTFEGPAKKPPTSSPATANPAPTENITPTADAPSPFNVANAHAKIASTTSNRVTPTERATTPVTTVSAGSAESNASPEQTAPEPPTTLPSGLRIVVVDLPHAARATIEMASPAYGANSPDRFAGAVAAHILGSDVHSRLRSFVRSDAGYAYSTRARFVAIGSAGYFVADARTEPQTAASTVATMVHAIQAMREHDVTDAELADAKGYLAAADRVRGEAMWQRVAMRVAREMGQMSDENQAVDADRVRDVSAQHVRRVIDQYVQVGAMTIVVVGPAAVVADDLRKIGDVQIVVPASVELTN